MDLTSRHPPTLGERKPQGTHIAHLGEDMSDAQGAWLGEGSVTLMQTDEAAGGKETDLGRMSDRQTKLNIPSLNPLHSMLHPELGTGCIQQWDVTTMFKVTLVSRAVFSCF